MKRIVIGNGTTLITGGLTPRFEDRALTFKIQNQVSIEERNKLKQVKVINGEELYENNPDVSIEFKNIKDIDTLIDILEKLKEM